jgi:hypothetical protein
MRNMIRNVRHVAGPNACRSSLIRGPENHACGYDLCRGRVGRSAVRLAPLHSLRLQAGAWDLNTRPRIMLLHHTFRESPTKSRQPLAAVRTHCRKWQTSTATPAKPGDLLFLFRSAKSSPDRQEQRRAVTIPNRAPPQRSDSRTLRTLVVEPMM